MLYKSSRVKSRRFTSRVLRCLRAVEDEAGRTRTSVCTTSLTLSQEGNSTFLTHPLSRNSLNQRCCWDSDTGRSPHALKPAITLEGLSTMALLHAVLTKWMTIFAHDGAFSSIQIVPAHHGINSGLEMLEHRHVFRAAGGDLRLLGGA